MRKFLPAVALLVLLMSASAARASCTWTSNPTNINFGTYSVFGGTNLTGTSTFQFNCTARTTVTVSLSRGTANSYTPRGMPRTTAPTTPLLPYNVFDDAANTIIWGDGTGGSNDDTVTAGNGGTTFTGTAYGTLFAGADVQAGTYLDTITVLLAWAGGNASKTFTVSATVSTTCSVSTVAVSFGAYDPVAANAATPLDANGTVNVLCTMGTPITVLLDLGQHASGTTRRMLSGAANFLNYEIYNNSGRTVIWNTVNTVSGTSTSKNTPVSGGLTAYGRIPAGQDVTMGAYADALLVTVNY
ncbi:MAG TPA: spore coat U domain-containing protein [Thermoanaerobaculia bacterium]|nr:spore coat U domain-containing protein [Thermoanaerobaculia bacterium]